jgi:demethylmenaquinone methyltransferase/2-methoxy-6-polyprenyl-1,4-benzoquinol methylase
MFDNIAPAYDFMNRAMTLGIDRNWRRKVVKAVAAAAPSAILDVATGTGDLAIQLAKANQQAKVTGIDLSEGMLEVGRRKVAEAGLTQQIALRQADCLALPFADGSFDIVTVAFGVRNFEHLDKGYAEMARVLRPGGKLMVLELSTPTSPIVKPFYKLYTRGVIPMVGRLISKDSRAYSYLPESIAAMPQGERMLQLMTEAGLSGCSLRSLTFGVSTIYTGIKS